MLPKQGLQYSENDRQKQEKILGLDSVPEFQSEILKSFMTVTSDVCHHFFRFNIFFLERTGKLCINILRRKG
jgi:hypothetical protein